MQTKTGDCIGLVNLTASIKIECVIALTKIKAIIIKNSIIQKLLVGRAANFPYINILKNPIEQEYLLSQFVSEGILIEYIENQANYQQ